MKSLLLLLLLPLLACGHEHPLTDHQHEYELPDNNHEFLLPEMPTISPTSRDVRPAADRRNSVTDRVRRSN